MYDMISAKQLKFQDQQDQIITGLLKAYPMEPGYDTLKPLFQAIEIHLLAGVKYVGDNPPKKYRLAYGIAEVYETVANHKKYPTRVTIDPIREAQNLYQYVWKSTTVHDCETLAPNYEGIEFDQKPEFVQNLTKLVEDLDTQHKLVSTAHEKYVKMINSTIYVMRRYESMDELLEAVPSLRPFAPEPPKKDTDDNKIKEVWGL